MKRIGLKTQIRYHQLVGIEKTDQNELAKDLILIQHAHYQPWKSVLYKSPMQTRPAISIQMECLWNVNLYYKYNLEKPKNKEEVDSSICLYERLPT